MEDETNGISSNICTHLLQFLFWFILVNSFLFELIGSRYLYYLLQSATLFSTGTTTYTTLLGKMFVLLFTFSTFFGHFSLLAYLSIGLFVLPFVFLESKWPVWILAILTSTSSTALLLLDSIVFSRFRFHLNWTILRLPIEDNASFTSFFALSSTEIYLGLSIICFICLFEIIMAYGIWKYCLRKKNWYASYFILAFLIGTLFLSHFLLIQSLAKRSNIFSHQTSYFPLYNQIIGMLLSPRLAKYINFYSETRFSQPRLPSVSLHYPLHPLQCAPIKKPYNVLIIGIDTWRFDSVTPTLMPHVSAFAQRSWRFTQHFSGGNSTQPGIFSLFYSLPGIYWQSMIDQKKGPVLIGTLLRNHYQIPVFFSAGILPFLSNVFSQLPTIRVQDAPGNTTPDRDRYVTQELIQFLKKRDKSHPFFGFILYYSAHDYCREQNFKFLFPVQYACNRLVSNELDKSTIRNRYWNAVHFIDEEIAKVLNALQEAKLDKDTIVLITGDHGEELGDHQSIYWGHTGNYTPYQVQTPLIVAWPNTTPHTWKHMTSHYDVVPTLMHRLLGCHHSTIDYALGTDLLDSTPRPYILASSYINIGIIEKGRNTTLYSSGDITVADEDANEIAGATPNMSVLRQVFVDMHRYDAT